MQEEEVRELVVAQEGEMVLAEELATEEPKDGPKNKEKAPLL